MTALARQPGAGHFRRSAAEGNDDRRAKGCGDMHWTAVVGEQDA